MAATISRLIDYHRRNGLRATLRRSLVGLNRTFTLGRLVLFYCDLSEQHEPISLAPSLRLDRVKELEVLSPEDLQRMTGFWHSELALRKMVERFKMGATLWVVRETSKLAAYGWTLQGRTVEPYFFPLSASDVHFFDFHVFEEYRGRRINPLLVQNILYSLGAECRGRAFIEAAEWNRSQLQSLRKTSFRYLGRVRKWSPLGRTIVHWSKSRSPWESLVEHGIPGGRVRPEVYGRQ